MMKTWLWRWGPALLWMILIFLGSSQPKDEGLIPDFGGWDFPIKKTAHLTEYAILALFLFRGCRGSSPIRAIHWIAAFLLAVLYSVTDECHQTFVPGRSGNIADVFIDAAGAAAGLLTFFCYYRIAKRAIHPS
jgi:VanZ family protein